MTVIFVAACFVSASYGQSIVERAKKDELAFIPKNDPAMEKAFRTAQERLDDFLLLAQKPSDTLKGFSLKVGISQGDDVEYFWIQKFEQNGNEFAGFIANTPRLVKRVRQGQRYEFKRSEIVDWTYTDPKKNRMYGNFTACVLLKKDSPSQVAEFKKQYGLECDL